MNPPVSPALLQSYSTSSMVRSKSNDGEACIRIHRGAPSTPSMNPSIDIARASTRLASIARMMWIILGLNVMIALAKLVYGYRSGAISITADGLHSLLDGASNVIGVIGMAIARRPADSNHPYGHRKYETFAALAMAIMLFFSCYEIVSHAIE